MTANPGPFKYDIKASYGSNIPVTGDDGLQGSCKIPELFKMVDMAIEIEKERSKALDALKARDATVVRLEAAYNSMRQKTALLERLQKENRIPNYNENVKSDGQQDFKLEQEIVKLESTVTGLRDEIRVLKENSNKSGLTSIKEGVESKPKALNDVEQDYFNSKSHFSSKTTNPFIYHTMTPPVLSRTSSQNSTTSSISSVGTVFQLEEGDFTIARSSPPSEEAEDLIKSRNLLLQSIPLPENSPDEELKPITLPAHTTLHEFLSNAPPRLRIMLPNYHALHELTTSWCPQREEHGYFLTPVFKCHTNPRVTTAHRWNSVDVLHDCFYNKNGKWYYAGVYQAFRLDDLTVKEWEALSNETTQSLIKSTLSARKNVSPQNVYEVSQLYSAGALKVACVGIQCVGFNKAMYHAILDYVNSTSMIRPGHGRATSRDIVDTMASLKVSE